MANQPIGIAFGVEHRQEMWQEFATGVFQSEILLMIAHHRDQNFIGEREELRIEIAEHDRRKLGEIHNCVEQGLVLAPARAREGSCGRVERLANALLAFGGTRYHRSLRQRR